MSLKKAERIVDEALLEEIRARCCVVCFAPPPSDPSHIKSVGSGGPDAEFNVFPMCRTCHTKWHAIGWSRFLTKHYGFWTILERYGWRRECGKLLNDRTPEVRNSYNLPRLKDV